MPSTLLLEVVGHRWTLYFACDRGADIDLFGPLDIGGTQTLTDAYGLAASLQAAKEWIEGPFRQQVEEWFVSDRIIE